MNVLQSTSKQTEARGAKPSATRAAKEQPPQISLLNRAFVAIQNMYTHLETRELAKAIEELTTASELNMVARAVNILDGLVASGIDLSEEAEASRKELRMLAGLSPSAPVSLEQALLEEGFSPMDGRERSLIRAIDEGIYIAIGGRGEKYEAIIRSIAEAITRRRDLQ